MLNENVEILIELHFGTEKTNGISGDAASRRLRRMMRKSRPKYA
jgi:hypothetical protein